MRDFLILLVHVLVTVARLARPGGLRSVVANPRWSGINCWSSIAESAKTHNRFLDTRRILRDEGVSPCPALLLTWVLLTLVKFVFPGWTTRLSITSPINIGRELRIKA